MSWLHGESGAQRDEEGREGAKYGEDIERNDDDSFFFTTIGLMIISWYEKYNDMINNHDFMKWHENHLESNVQDSMLDKGEWQEPRPKS